MHSDQINKAQDNNKKIIPKRKKRKIRLAGPVRKGKPDRSFRVLPESEKQKILDKKRTFSTVTLFDSDSDSLESLPQKKKQS